MSLRRYSNNASTQLSAPISATATGLSVVAGTGAQFPALVTPQIFAATIVKNGQPGIYEIVLVTAHAGDTFTISRGQEGTTALLWNAGDVFTQLPTAGDFYGFVQFDDLQNNAGGYAPDTGSANAYVVGLTPPITAHQIGVPIRWKAQNTNTGNSTFNDGAGVAALKTPSGSQIAPGLIVAGGIYTSIWDGTQFQFSTANGFSVTPQERNAGVTVYNTQYSNNPHDVRRYSALNNYGSGTTDDSPAWAALSLDRESHPLYRP